MARSMFLLLPAFALILKMLYPSRLYVQHLLFAIYQHAFAFMVSGVASLPEAIGLGGVGTWVDLIMLWLPVYLFLSMRRFYGGGRVGTFLRWLVLTVLYGVLGILTVLTLFLIGLLLG